MLIRNRKRINTFDSRQMSHSAAESEKSWGSRKREGGKTPIPAFSLSHLKQLLELYAAFTTLFISSLLGCWMALSAILYRDLLDFNNPSIESQSGCAYTQRDFSDQAAESGFSGFAVSTEARRQIYAFRSCIYFFYFWLTADTVSS